ncbi:MAG: hypothetical protein HY587_04410 [Candidatus Omnitrophica bacterium]|nr:hypothetical protein [Candidatus Omnitrophota bacterium]
MKVIRLKYVLVIIFISAIPLLIAAPTVRAESADHPYVEGTMYDNSNPTNSVAMISGQPYKVGDSIGKFIVTEIFANGVKLKDSSNGEEKSFFVGSDQAQLTPKKPGAPGENPMEAAGKFFSGLLGKGDAAGGIGLRPALQGIRKALMEYRSEAGRFPENLAVLAQEGRINPHVAEGVGGYQFSYERLGQSFTLYAEPRWPSSEVFYYFMDDIGRLRAEKGRRADHKSAVVDL